MSGKCLCPGPADRQRMPPDAAYPNHEGDQLVSRFKGHPERGRQQIGLRLRVNLLAVFLRQELVHRGHRCAPDRKGARVPIGSMLAHFEHSKGGVEFASANSRRSHQCRVSAIRMVSVSGIGCAPAPDQVGAWAKSCRDMSRDAMLRPKMPTNSIGAATGRPNQPNQGL